MSAPEKVERPGWDLDVAEQTVRFGSCTRVALEHTCLNLIDRCRKLEAERDTLRQRNERQASIFEECPSCLLKVLRTDAEWPLAKLRKRAEAAEQQCDAQMLLVKACEHIAEGDEGWQKLRNECPSAAAVASLREAFEAAEQRVRELERQVRAFVKADQIFAEHFDEHDSGDPRDAQICALTHVISALGLKKP